MAEYDLFCQAPRWRKVAFGAFHFTSRRNGREFEFVAFGPPNTTGWFPPPKRQERNTQTRVFYRPTKLTLHVHLRFQVSRQRRQPALPSPVQCSWAAARGSPGRLGHPGPAAGGGGHPGGQPHAYTTRPCTLGGLTCLRVTIFLKAVQGRGYAPHSTPPRKLQCPHPVKSSV